MNENPNVCVKIIHTFGFLNIIIVNHLDRWLWEIVLKKL